MSSRSSDAFSFDAAMPVEAADNSVMESNESSGMHSSPDDSFLMLLAHNVPSLIGDQDHK